MNGLRELYGRLDRLQRGRVFRIVATVIVLAASGAVFGSLIATTYSLDTQRGALVSAMTGQNLTARDQHAITLAEAGTITVSGRTYGGARFAERPDLIFDENGDIMVVDALAEALLRDQRPGWAPRWLLEQPGTTWMLALLFTAWLVLIVWMDLALPFVLTALGTAVCVGLAAWGLGDQWMWAFGGMGLLTFSFVLLTRTALLVLRSPNQVLAVAHTVVKEASRTRISLVFIVVILIMLPLLPLGLDAASPLRFQLQTFISRSLGFTFYLAACMTLFLSCATVAFEIRDRQIWQLMTKPVSRLSYLLGKWLGVVTMNLIILSIAAVSIFTFIQYLRDRPVAAGASGYEDAQQVRDAVLTARLGTKPVYAGLTTEQMRARVDELISRRAEFAGVEDVPLHVRRELQAEVREAFAIGQRSVPPQGEREFRFENLHSAREQDSMLTLRYRFHILRDDEHETFPALFYFNGNPNLSVQRRYVPTLSHVLTIPPDFIQEDGSLTVTVANLYRPPPTRRGVGALNFEERDFELLFKAGSFEGNFVRAVFMDWVKLSFLAMLGICCGTFLSFPVACLTSFTVFIAGTIGPFLARSLEEYYPPSLESVDWSNIAIVVQWAFKSMIRVIAQVIVLLLEAFGEYRPTQLLVEGRLISWPTVLLGSLKVGVLWSGIALVVGWMTMRRRQLAIYSGQG